MNTTEVVQVTQDEFDAMIAVPGPYLSCDEADYYGHIVAAKSLLDHREVHVYPLLFGRARLCVGQGPQPSGYSDVWDYPSKETAVAALQRWDGEVDPGGWQRHSHRP